MKRILARLCAASLLIAASALADGPASVIGGHATVGTDGSQTDGSVNLITRNAGPINFYTNNTKRGYIDGSTGAFTGVTVESPTLNSPIVSGNISFSGSNSALQTNTSDAADNKCASITGGGALATDGTRGGFLKLCGNEEGGNPGVVSLFAGANSTCDLGTIGNNSVKFFTQNLRRWIVGASGDLSQDGTNGSDLTFNKANTGLALTVTTGISAAGSTLGTATVLTTMVNNVTTVGASQGVNLWNANTGVTIIVKNGGANALSVYPFDASGSINGGAGGAAVSIATGATGFFTKVAANTWIATEAPQA